MSFFQKFFSIIFCLSFLTSGVVGANEYPKYMGEDCSAEGYGEYGLTGIPEVDQYCSHIVCEEEGYCIPYHEYVYDVPAFDYRGVKIVTGGYDGMLLRSDGGAISWGAVIGMLNNRQDIRSQLKSGVEDIYSGGSGFAVLKNDGTLLTWGHGENYGEVDSKLFIANIATELAAGVDQVFSTPAGFVALTKANSVVSWGDGRNKNGKITQGYKVPGLSASDVSDVFMNVGGEQPATESDGGYATERGKPAFAALKKDGTVVVWGDKRSGGKIGGKRTGLQNVIKISSTKSAFAALRSNGSVAVWGNSYQGGSPLVIDPYGALGKPQSVQQKISSNVKEIYANDTAFAAVKNDGSVVTWGTSYQGGDSSTVAHLLENVQEIIPSYNGFTALRKDGITVSWGEWLEPPYIPAPVHTGVRKVVGNWAGAYAALKNDGSVVTWGNILNGIDSIASALESGVAEVYADQDSFVALKEDGSLVAWGDRFNENGVYERYAQNGYFNARGATDPERIKTIISSVNDSGFFAIRNDGSFISWGATTFIDHTYDFTNDPIWSEIIPDHYVWYFDIEPKKRNALANTARALVFASPPSLSDNGNSLVARNYGEWVVFDALPASDDNGIRMLWLFSVQGYESDGVTFKDDVCFLWTNFPYVDNHRRIVSGPSSEPGDICRVRVVGESFSAPYYADYTGVSSVNLTIVGEAPLL